MISPLLCDGSAASLDRFCPLRPAHELGRLRGDEGVFLIVSGRLAALVCRTTRTLVRLAYKSVSEKSKFGCGTLGLRRTLRCGTRTLRVQVI
jgi:hypothetical protein